MLWLNTPGQIRNYINSFAQIPKLQHK